MSRPQSRQVGRTAGYDPAARPPSCGQRLLPLLEPIQVSSAAPQQLHERIMSRGGNRTKISCYCAEKNVEYWGALDKIFAKEDVYVYKSSLDPSVFSGSDVDMRNFQNYDKEEREARERERAKEKSDAKAKKGGSVPVVTEKRVKRSQMIEKLDRLRLSLPDRQAFFEEIGETIKARSTVIASSESAVKKNRHLVRAATPSIVQEKLMLRCCDRDQRIQRTKLAREELREQKKQHFLDIVEKARGTGLVVADEEISLHQRKEAVVNVWKIILVVRNFVHVALAFSSETRATNEAIAKEQRLRYLEQHAFIAVRLQSWWRGIKLVAAYKQRKKATDIIRQYLGGVDRLRFQFKMAMTKLLSNVRRVQHHFRTVLVCRQLRRAYAVDKMKQIVEKKIAAISVEIAKAHKEISKTSSLLAKAIKARKPVFQTQLTKLEASSLELEKKRGILESLTVQHMNNILSPILADTEEKYGEELLEYGRKLADKYHAEFNQEGLLRRQQSRYGDTLKTTSITAINLVKSFESAESTKHRRFFRPSALMIPSHDQMVELVETTGMELAFNSFLEKETERFVY